MQGVRRVVVVGYHAVEVLDVAAVVSTLQFANYLHGSALYDVALAAPGGGTIRTGTGLTLVADHPLEEVRGPLDTLVVAGGIGFGKAMRDRVLVAHVRRLARESDRIASVCTGSGVLAAAGVLDGRRAATHWSRAEGLARRFPAVRFDPHPIHLRDGNVYTSAGVTAGLDLTLALVEADAGAELARTTARHLVTYLQRPGNQAQMSMFTAARAPGSPVVREVVAHVNAHLDDDLTTDALARRAGLSARHLCRLFDDELDLSPARYVRQARCEAAAQLLTGSDLTVEAVAGRCGFGTVETLRQAFQRHYGVSPSHYRRTQRSTERPAGPAPGD